MTPFVEFPWLTVFVIAIVVMVLLSALSPKRPPPQIRAPRQSAIPPPQIENRICFFCKAEQAPYASFCKTCGKRL